MKLTEREIKVIKVYKKDDFVNDCGFEDPDAATWVKNFHKDCGMNGKEFSGVMSSLCKKGFADTNGESWWLTEKGIDEARKI